MHYKRVPLTPPELAEHYQATLEELCKVANTDEMKTYYHLLIGAELLTTIRRMVAYKYGLTSSRYEVLSAIVNFGDQNGISQNELNDYILTSQQSISSCVRGLQRKGLLKIKRIKERGRAHHLQLTDEGIKTIKAASKAVDEHMEKVLSVITKKDKAQIRQLLSNLSETIKKKPASTFK